MLHVFYHNKTKIYPKLESKHIPEFMILGDTVDSRKKHVMVVGSRSHGKEP